LHLQIVMWRCPRCPVLSCDRSAATLVTPRVCWATCSSESGKLRISFGMPGMENHESISSWMLEFHQVGDRNVGYDSVMVIYSINFRDFASFFYVLGNDILYPQIQPLISIFCIFKYPFRSTSVPLAVFRGKSYMGGDSAGRHPGAAPGHADVMLHGIRYTHNYTHIIYSIYIYTVY